MNEKIKDRIWYEEQYAKEVMLNMRRAHLAAKHDKAENCIGILKALHDTTANERVLKLIEEVKKEQNNG